MDKLFICKYKECNQYFTQPVTLPCGNNICKQHVEERVTTNETDILKCYLCSDEHHVPKYGFPINICLNEAICDNVHLNDDKRKVLHLLNKLKSNADDLDLLIKDPERFIYDYVANLKNKVDLERERLINQINETSDGLINRLKQFEAECKQKLKESRDIMDQNKTFLKILFNQKENWSKEIQMPKITESKIEVMTKEIRRNIDDVKEKFIDYKNSLLNNKGSCFVPKKLNFNEEFFGEFKIDDTISIKTLAIEKRNSVLNSQILSADESIDLLKLCEFDVDANTFELIYRASKDGFRAEDFHRQCDGKANTLTIIRESKNKYVFGGFTQSTWDKSGNFKADDKAFLFSFKNKPNNPLKLGLLEPLYSVHCGIGGGPTFGRGHDIFLCNDSNKTKESYSNLGVSFNHPPITSTSNDGFLAGERLFLTENIEVYVVS